jgi:hypothetical protein
MNRPTAGAGALAVLLLAACGGTTGPGGAAGTMDTSATGTGAATTGTAGTGTGTTAVTGRFLMEGGPVRPGGDQPGERPLRGTVTGERTVSVPVGRAGTFSVALAAGTYHVSGRSPQIMEVSGGGTQHETACSQPLTVHVTGQRTLKITVTCIVP